MAVRQAFPGKPSVDAAALGMKASLCDQRAGGAGPCGTLSYAFWDRSGFSVH